jgi:hypothetical protein
MWAWEVSSWAAGPFMSGPARRLERRRIINDTTIRSTKAPVIGSFSKMLRSTSR